MGKKKEKVAHTGQRANTHLKPMNPKQGEYIRAIEANKIVCGTGVAGTGKTYIAAKMAAKLLLEREIQKIVISRPNELEGTRTIGLLPGTLEEKMAPVLAPVVEVLIDSLGKTQYDYLVKKGMIEYLPLEFIKGRTFDNCFVIIDEAEDITKDILKVLLLRTGNNCKIVIDGDVAQKSIDKASGLAALLDLSKKAYLPIEFVDFPSWDEHCVRSDEVKYLGKLFDEFDF